MKVFISADMEGISGLVDQEDTTIGGREYERALMWLAIHTANDMY